MTLAEAIAHEDWAASTAHGELAAEHAQMRDWLRVLERLRSARDVWQGNDVELREQIHWLKKGDILHVLTDQEYIDQCERERLMQVSIDALDKDNAKLREQSERLFDKALELATENSKLRELCKLCEREAENAKLRERVAELEELLPDSGRWYRAETVEAYVAEIAKLRELARGLGQCAQGVGCEDCLLYDLSEPDHCREERLSRELGIEVG